MMTANNQQIFYVNPKHIPQVDLEATKTAIKVKSRAIGELEAEIRKVESQLQDHQVNVPELLKETEEVKWTLLGLWIHNQ